MQKHEHVRSTQRESQHSVRLANGSVEVVLATQVGPRILHYGLLGRRNVLAELPSSLHSHPTSYGEPWHIFGGHRLWYAPEHAERSYYPDNQPVAVERLARGVCLTQPVELGSGLEKSITVELAAEGSHVTLRHRLVNRGSARLELAPWALTAMAPGGRAYFPHPPYVPHPEALAPARPLVLWPFTRMSDPRFGWGDSFVSLRQDPTRADPQKIGLYDPLGYMAYALEGQLFIKRHTPRAGLHADFGCNVQAFTNAFFLELETLGPLVSLGPLEQVEHEEHWFLFEAEALAEDEGELTRLLAPLLQQTEQDLAGQPSSLPSPASRA
ncbi:MAG: hypothetical protein JWN04_5332 [Myxococcaceae bacterium]|nr:hypothetical protein [Myxococcaceae bacterium]